MKDRGIAMKKHFLKRVSWFLVLTMLVSIFSGFSTPKKVKAAEMVGAGDIIRNNTFDGE